MSDRWFFFLFPPLHLSRLSLLQFLFISFHLFLHAAEEGQALFLTPSHEAVRTAARCPISLLFWRLNLCLYLPLLVHRMLQVSNHIWLTSVHQHVLHKKYAWTTVESHCYRGYYFPVVEGNNHFPQCASCHLAWVTPSQRQDIAFALVRLH